MSFLYSVNFNHVSKMFKNILTAFSININSNQHSWEFGQLDEYSKNQYYI